MKLTRILVIRTVLVLLMIAAAILPCCGCCLGLASFGSSEGSTELAVKWRAEFQHYATPDEAEASNSGIKAMKFPNGEWIFWRSQSSERIWLRGGGTIVLRDSTGQTRIFYGHVRGHNDVAGADSEVTKTLADFYKRLCENFSEHILD